MRDFRGRERYWSLVLDLERQRLVDALEEIAHCTESPIEEAAVTGAWVAASGHPFCVYSWEACETLIDFGRGSQRESEISISLILQQQIGAYRADIVVVASTDTLAGDFRGRCIVELDGHDFHERTKEQAARDKKRDRDMVVGGDVVLRFTGSEIIKDPTKCMREAIDLAVKRCRQAAIREGGSR